MSADDHADRLYDAFDRILEARFHGNPLNAKELEAESPAMSEAIEAASRLADEVGPPGPSVGLPSIAGYRILQEIGHGGMGIVYLAEQEGLARRVAIKVLSPSLALSQRSRRRFLGEAKALASLADEHIVAVHDVFERGAVLAYAMEWVEGCSLQQLLLALRQRDSSAQFLGKQPGLVRDMADLARELGVDAECLPARTPLQFFLQTGIAIARALHRVHEAGIVHRDVKPGNILIRKNGQALLADFGLAHNADASVSLTSGFVGTLIYASPEQLRADEQALDVQDADVAKCCVDQRSDIYSLAVTLYELLTGAPPFRARTTAELLARISSGHATRLLVAAPGLPRDLELVLAKAMDPEPAERYQDAAHLADDLERILDLEPVHARPIGLPRRLARFVRRKRRSLAAAAIGAVFMLGLGLLWMIEEARQREIPRRVLALRRRAHLQLLQPQLRRATWLDFVRGEASPLAFERAQQGRRAALHDYEQALLLAPGPRLAAEHAALALVLELPTISKRAVDVEALRARFPALGRVSSLVIRSLTRSSWLLPVDGRPSFKAASIRLSAPRFQDAERGSESQKRHRQRREKQVLEERRVWGLLGFLAGAKEICEDSWSFLDQGDWDLPLIDVALAQIYRDGGRPALALQRLQAALAAFPSLEGLHFDLVDIAIELLDYRTAMHVLRAMRVPQRSTLRWKTLHARALAILDPQEARRELQKLLAQQVGGPLAASQARAAADTLPGFALAQIDLRLGHAKEALPRLERLVQRHRHVARYRLLLARAALLLGKADRYLVQLRYVVDSRYGLFRSIGETRDLLDIIQLGGLRALYAHAVSLRHQFGSPDIMGVSDEFWEARKAYGSRQAVEALFLPKTRLRKTQLPRTK